ncbi:MAG: hypothetical protein LBQ31_07795 [Bacteroidales bacterium]|jgi:hypothetical protein|nr:hypothetical protein [Bacteroidales bacterium]
MKQIFIFWILFSVSFSAHSQGTQQSPATDIEQLSISDCMLSPQDWLKEQILLVGTLNISKLRDTLMQLRYNLNFPFSTRWACMLALARMGEKTAIDEVLAKVSTKKTDDNMIYLFYPDLIYTRQRKIFDFLITRMQDKNGNCFSANPNNPQKIDCGYRIMELLAPVISDFPKRTSSYKKSLNKARKWCKKHSHNYRITGV